MSVAVLLHLPDDVYRALVPVAAKNDTQVHRIIEVSVTKSVRKKKRTVSRITDRIIEVSVTKSVRKKKRTVSRITDEQLAEIRRMNAEGASDAAIAKALGVAQSTASRWRGNMGLASPTPRVGGRQKAVST